MALATVEITPVSDHIATKEKAYFDLKITNSQDQTQTYQLFSLELLQWMVEPLQLKDKVVTLAPKESYTVQVSALPLKDFYPGIYYVSLTVSGDQGEQYEGKLKVYYGPAQPASYAPAVTPVFTITEKVNPQEPLSVKLSLENRNSLNLSNMRVRVECEDAPEFNKVFAVALEPLEKKNVELTLTPYRHQQPQLYTLKFIFESYGVDFKTVEQEVEVLTMIPSFTVIEVQEESVFFKIFRRFTVFNDGNVQNTQNVKYPTNLLEGILTLGDAEMVKANGQRYLSWPATLGPGESTFVYSVTDYRLLFYLIVILLGFLVFYFWARTPVVVKKTATALKKDSEGALSEIKVMIEVKNTAKYPLKEVVVQDLIPAYAALLRAGEKEGNLESAHPHKVSHVKEGTRLSWIINDLESQEPRVMVYHLKAKLNILGGVNLPRAIVEFTRKKGRKGKAYSGIFKLGEQ
jgi:hypothetical protein